MPDIQDELALLNSVVINAKSLDSKLRDIRVYEDYIRKSREDIDRWLQCINDLNKDAMTTKTCLDISRRKYIDFVNSIEATVIASVSTSPIPEDHLSALENRSNDLDLIDDNDYPF